MKWKKGYLPLIVSGWMMGFQGSGYCSAADRRIEIRDLRIEVEKVTMATRYADAAMQAYNDLPHKDPGYDPARLRRYLGDFLQSLEALTVEVDSARRKAEGLFQSGALSKMSDLEKFQIRELFKELRLEILPDGALAFDKGLSKEEERFEKDYHDYGRAMAALDKTLAAAYGKKFLEPKLNWSCARPAITESGSETVTAQDYAEELKCLVDWMNAVRVYFQRGGRQAEGLDPRTFEDERIRAKKVLEKLSKWIGDAKFPNVKENAAR